MDYRSLVTMGRKAGLNTSELYRALAARRLQASDRTFGQTDSNGYVPVYGEGGRQGYQPATGRRRP